MAQRTKKALAEALKHLLEKKTLDKITVSDLTDACGLNRQTFYYHFKDIYDLLEWIYKEDAAESGTEEKLHENWQEAYLRLLCYAKNNRALVMNTYHCARRELLYDYVHHEAYLFVKKVVDEYAGTRLIREEDKVFLAKFYQYAFVGILLDWLDNGMKEEPEQIIDQVNMAIEGNIAAAFDRMERKHAAASR
jgi:probable dihydroxyacetone kinase regulator